MFTPSRTRKRAVAFSLLVAFQLAAQLFFTPTPVSAAPADTATIDSQVSTYLWGNWLRACFVKHNLVIGSKEALQSFAWFNADIINPNLALGHAAVNSASSADAACNDTNRVRQAVEALGWSTSNPSAILCEIGYNNCNGTSTPVIVSPPSNVDQNSYRIFRLYWGESNQPALTSAMRYWLARKTIMLACSAQKVTAAGDGVVSIKEVDATGKVTEVFYKIAGGAQISTYVDVGPNFTDVKPMCNELADWASQDANVQAFATWVEKNAAAAQTMISALSSGVNGAAAAGETCMIEGIGWIVCPAMNFIAKVTDSAYAAAENFLFFSLGTNALDTGDNAGAVYKVWSTMRNFANVAFVVAFFMVIFSQATSVGISAYGVRKMLPRLIAAAILVNLSYFICIFAVDVSNIIGAGIDGIITNAGTSALTAQEPAGWAQKTTTILAGGAIAAAAAATTGFGLIWGLLSILIPFLAAAFLGVLVALVVLVGRQAALIMLIIISPLAFVAYILPNTEGLFDKWRKFFTTLLVFYPLVAVLFAGSKVASQVLVAVAQQNKSFTGDLIEIFGLGVAFIPLFGMPWLLKFSGGFLGRIAGMVNDRNKGLIDRSKNFTKSQGGLARGRAADTYDPNRKGWQRLKNTRARFAVKPGVKGFDRSSRARADALIQQIGDSYGAEERKIAAASFSQKGISGDKEALYKIAMESSSGHERFAAMLQLGEIGAADRLEDLYRGKRDSTGARLGSKDAATKSMAASAIGASSGKLVSAANPLFFDAATYQSQIRAGKSQADAEAMGQEVREQKVSTQMGASYLSALRGDQIIGARETIVHMTDPAQRAASTASVQAAITRISGDPRMLSDLSDEQITEIGKMARTLGIASATAPVPFRDRYITAANSITAAADAKAARAGLPPASAFIAGERPNVTATGW